jgi:DNA polymerase I-like protein with 3'-5' exonuclease and polymerase domains
MRNELIQDAIYRAYRLSYDLYGKDYQPAYYCPRTAKDVVTSLEGILEELKTNPRICSVDIESNYVKEFGERMGDYWHKDYAVWCLGFSLDDYQAICIPFDPDERLITKFGLTSIFECPRILELVIEILSFNCVTHSTSDALGLGAKYKVLFKDMDDTLLIQYAIDDTAGDLGLDDLSRIHSEEGGYKKREYSGHVAATIDQLDWDDFTKYCCHDTDIERRFYFLFKAKAIEENVWEAYTKVLKVSNQIGIKMTLNGVAMNRPHLEGLIKIEEDKKAPLVKELYARKELTICFEYIKNLIATQPKHKQIKKLVTVTSITDIKISKSWVLEILLYDVCKFPCLNKTEKGARGTEAEDLEKVKGKIKGSEHLIDLILEIKRIDKKLSTYLLPYVQPKIKDIEDLSQEEIDKRSASGDVERYPYLKDDGFIHSRFLYNVARSGRSVSRDPNFQNLISDLLIKMSFISRWGSRGRLMLPDYAQQEVRMCAWLCNDANMIKALELDFHTINQSTQAKILAIKDVPKVTKAEVKVLKNTLYFQCLEKLLREKDYGLSFNDIKDSPYYEVMKALAEDGDPKFKLLEGLWEEAYQKKRTVAKESTFGPLYGMMPPSFAKIQEISLADAEDVYATDRKLYPTKHAYFAEEIRKMRRNGFVQSIFGKKRRLFYKFAKTDEDRAQLDRQGANQLIQGPSSDIGVLSMGKCMSTFEELGIQEKTLGCGTIHDSLFLDYQTELQETLEIIVPEIMESYPEELMGPGPVKFKVDLKYGDNWGELKKV